MFQYQPKSMRLRQSNAGLRGRSELRPVATKLDIHCSDRHVWQSGASKLSLHFHLQHTWDFEHDADGLLLFSQISPGKYCVENVATHPHFVT